MLRPKNGIRDSERSRSQIENGLLFGNFSHVSTFGLTSRHLITFLFSSLLNPIRSTYSIINSMFRLQFGWDLTKWLLGMCFITRALSLYVANDVI